jgi:putative NADPH-quinone reductase
MITFKSKQLVIWCISKFGADRMVLVLGLLGSFRKGGNSELLLDNFLTGAENVGATVEKIRIPDLAIKPCLNCGGCDSTGECVQKDDMRDVYNKLLTYDIIVLSSPVYFMGITAWAKALIDRCQALWVRKYKLEKLPEKPKDARRGVYLSVAGMNKPTVFDGARLTVKSFFATLDISFQDELVFYNIDEKSDIFNHPSALREAKELGEKLVNDINQ